MPCLSQVVARWDAENRKVRYYASFEGIGEEEPWIEVPAEDVDVCHQIYELVDDVKALLDDVSVFREGLEKLSEITKARAERTEN